MYEDRAADRITERNFTTCCWRNTKANNSSWYPDTGPQGGTLTQKQAANNARKIWLAIVEKYATPRELTRRTALMPLLTRSLVDEAGGTDGIRQQEVEIFTALLAV